MLDKQDEGVLAQLQRDGRGTNQQLADRLGMSASACWRRVRALEESGVIAGYSVVLDREKAGFAMAAILHVKLDRHETRVVDSFVKGVRARAEVLDCYATTGDADYHLRVVVRDMAAYNRFLEDFLFRLPGIRHVQSNIVLKEIKSTVALPFSDA